MKEKLRPYLQALPDIFKYQIISKPLLALLLLMLGLIFRVLLKSAGKVAVTSGDLAFLFTTWQGWLIVLLGLVTLYLYFAFDLNTMIIISRDLVAGKKAKVFKSMKEGFSSIRSFISGSGLPVVLYIAFIGPLLGFAFSISATEGFYVPTFISSVIETSPLLLIPTYIVMLLFLIYGIGNFFILHGVALDKMTVKDSKLQSKKLVRANLKDYIKQTLLFIITMVISVAVVVLVAMVLPLFIINMLDLSAGAGRVVTILFVLLGCVVSTLTAVFAQSFFFMKVTQLYYAYKDGAPEKYVLREKGKHAGAVVLTALIAVLIVFGTVMINDHFDQLFPSKTNVKIIAHRAGGIEAPENTVAGIDAAYKYGAWGTEIDIQRTKDGKYIILHDGNFERVAGDDRTPGEMTLAQIRKLSVDGEKVPTFEEILSACKGRLVLFAELKGESADKEMADYVVKEVRKRGMTDECVLISLDYGLMDYIETKYPDMQTGFLLFISFGETASLNCDFLGLEEESAGEDTIENIHNEKKQVMVWTPNEEKAQRQFLCSSADAIITDNVKQAAHLIKELEKRSDIERMIDRLFVVIS